jgi:RNA polymerase-interacting CarD/CdnL/TRCF family regulator
MNSIAQLVKDLHKEHAELNQSIEDQQMNLEKAMLRRQFVEGALWVMGMIQKGIKAEKEENP